MARLAQIFRAVSIFLAMLAACPSLAQTPLPGTTPTPNPPGQWSTGVPGSATEYFPTPDLACRRQHQAYNPGATYQPPTYGAYWVFRCNWIASQSGGPPGSNTILPGSVYLTCPSGYVRSRASGCRPDSGNEPECDCTELSQPVGTLPNPLIGNPVSIATGSKTEYQVDYESADGLFQVARYYRSLQHNADRQSTTPIPGFGPNWHGILPGRIAVYGSYTHKVEYLPVTGGYDMFKAANTVNRSVWTFVPDNNDGLHPEGSTRRKFEVTTTPTVDRTTFFNSGAAVVDGPAEFKLSEADGSYTLYRRAGAYNAGDEMRYLVPIEQVSSTGYARYFDYDDTGEYPTKITDSFGREMTLSWTEAQLQTVYVPTGGGPSSNILYDGPTKIKVISQIALPDGTKLVYSYGSTSTESRIGREDKLTRVSRQDALGTELWAREYLYEDSLHPYALTGMVDQNGQRLSTYTYHPYGLVKSSERAGGFGRIDIEYSRDAPNSRTYRAVTNPLGREEKYEFYRNLGALRNVPSALARFDGFATASVPAETRAYTYAFSSSWSRIVLLTKAVDARGTVTNFTNDAGQLRPTSIQEAAGTGVTRTRTIQWHPTLDLPTRIDVPGLRTEFTYGSTGKLLTRTLTDTTTHSLPYATAGQTRTESYSWGPGGRLLSIDGPKAALGTLDDITSFTYDSAGNLLSMTNGLGQVTTFADYDANGRPGSMTDPNGVETQFAYDALGRLQSNTVKHPTTPALDATTSYDYDVEGRVTGITLPATGTLSFTYDLAGQLLEMTAPDGEKISFSHDAMGNVTEEKILRADGAVRGTTTRTFDSIGRMLTETLGPGRTTAWEYDKNGNPVRTTSPRSYATDMAFDALNRLTSTLAPDTGSTATQYNARDEMTQFTDAVSVQTSFVRNGFGEVIQETSPDRGTSSYYYDVAGDLVAAIDGRGQRVDYTRDILGRVTAKTPVGRPASETITYSYDSGGASGCYCVGRLASMTDASGTTNFGYDHRGNLTVKAQPVGTLSWTYDLADRIVEMRYPSGRDVAYVRDSKGRIIEVKTRADPGSAWTQLASNITYEPFGPMKSADLGNGLKLSQDWGSDRRLAAKRLHTGTGADIWHLSYSYDDDDNITLITDLVTSANSRSFGYDSVDRLTRADGAGGAYAREDYVHDKNGNRIAVERRINVGDTTPAESDNYARTSGTNRIATVALGTGGTRNFTHDARGNLIGEVQPGVALTLTYDGHARLVSYAEAGASAQAMLYNGFDERVGLTTMLGGSAVDDRRFVYDEGHRITGEYGSIIGDLRAEYIWMQPSVGEAGSFGGGNGLGGYMPLAVAVPDVASTKLLWTQGNHLGTPGVTTDASGAVVTPSGYGRIGFPGQIEQHAGLYYNYYRDYDASTGRYVQADPIGLEGGSNPYLYAESSPLNNVDPDGLQVGAWDPSPSFVPEQPVRWAIDPAPPMGCIRDHTGKIRFCDPPIEEIYPEQWLIPAERGVAACWQFAKGVRVWRSVQYARYVRMRGLQDPVSHNFPYSFDKLILKGNPQILNNGYRRYRHPGFMNKTRGVYEIGVTKTGIINHRFFRPD